MNVNIDKFFDKDPENGNLIPKPITESEIKNMEKHRIRLDQSSNAYKFKFNPIDSLRRFVEPFLQIEFKRNGDNLDYGYKSSFVFKVVSFFNLRVFLQTNESLYHNITQELLQTKREPDELPGIILDYMDQFPSVTEASKRNRIDLVLRALDSYTKLYRAPEPKASSGNYGDIDGFNGFQDPKDPKPIDPNYDPDGDFANAVTEQLSKIYGDEEVE